MPTAAPTPTNQPLAIAARSPPFERPTRARTTAATNASTGSAKMKRRNNRLPPEIAPPAGSLEARALVTIRTQLP
jgi:hypothetical protein